MPPPHKSAAYKPVEIPNPFREGQDKAYADLLLDKQKEMKWWRGIIGVGFLLLFMISLFFNVHAVSQQKTVPVLVNVMPSGEAQYLGEVRQNAALTVPEAAVQYQVRKFITNLRSVSTDPQVLYNNIDECYAMITNRYEPIMTRSLRGNSPFDLVGKTRRSVEVESVLKVTGSSYQVDFFEVSTDNQGTRRTARFRALATVILLPVGDDAIKKNPLGIYIENYEVTEL